jgi:hypothetical protein
VGARIEKRASFFQERIVAGDVQRDLAGVRVADLGGELANLLQKRTKSAKAMLSNED